MKGYRYLIKTATVLMSSCLLAACGDGKPPAPNPATLPVPVNLYEVQPEKVMYHERYPGTVVPQMQVDLRAVSEGYVTAMYFKEGEFVKKGQRLYAIDDSKYKANVNQIQANVRVAESNLDQAQKDADRYIYLNQHDAVAKQLLDHAMTTLQNAKSQVAAAKQDLVKAQTDLNYSIIKAPFDGTIGISQVKLGNTVSAGQTVLNTISTDDPMAVDFVVNEKQIGRFVQLQQQKSIEADSIFTLQLPDNSVYPQPGKIAIIDRGVNPQTGTMTIRLSFPNKHAMLRAGMSCTVRVRNDDTAVQMMIPSKAIVEQMGEYFVYVQKDTAIAIPDSKEAPKTAPHALQKKVVTGQTIADQVIIRSGLDAGDKVVVDGVQRLRNGALIAVGEAKK